MMVMFATATTASTKKTNDVVIMLKNHERAIHVNAGGKVTATDISLAQFFSMESVGDIFSDTFKIALYAKEVGRYLCFRRGKLVGMKNITRDCHFIESLDHGYFLYANAYNPLWRVGFTRGLKPVGPRHWKRPQTLKRACFLFVKINAEHFDRSRFTTTTTSAPRVAATRSASAVTLREGHKLHDSKASIIDSNSYKRTKSANNGQRQRVLNSENVNATGGRNRQWSEREVMGQRHRKRKHHVKMAAASNNNGSSGSLQPKNLVRHHHDQGNWEGRRHQHQREEKERKLRLQNQRRQQQHLEDDNLDSEPMQNTTNSASPSVAATTLAATASLAPSALNIVAMLAAGRRKRGRRKKQVETSDTNLSSNSGQHQAMDLQLVAQTPLQAQSQYDRVPLDSTKSQDHYTHKLRHHHEHNYYQKQQPQQTIAPVNSTSPSTKKVLKKQQQNHKYSNSNRDSQLNTRTNSSSSSSRSSINSNNLSHNLNLNLNYNLNNINLNNNNYNNNNNNNDNIYAIPALPKKYLSKNNLMQQTTRSSTDFNTKIKQFSHFATHSRLDEQQQTQPQINNRSDHSHTSHDFYKLQLPLFEQRKSDSDNDNDDDDDDYNDNDNDSDMNDKNSNRLLVNNRNIISDNNLQQGRLVNRFKPIYLDRIRSHNLNLKSNNTKNMNNTNNYNNENENNSPISSTTTTKTTNEHNFMLENFTQRNDFSSITEFQPKSSGSSRSSSSGHSSNIISKSSSSRSTAFYNDRNNHSHRRFKRNIIVTDHFTNNKLYNYIKNNEESKDNNVKNNNNNDRTSSKGSSSSSGSSSHISNNKIINVLENLIDNNVNNIFKKNQQEYSNILKPSTTAYRNSKLLTILGRQQQQQQQQQRQIIKLINNPNKFIYNNFNDKDNDFVQDDGEKFKRIQNKYEKIIVQYRSVFNCLEFKELKKKELREK